MFADIRHSNTFHETQTATHSTLYTEEATGWKKHELGFSSRKPKPVAQFSCRHICDYVSGWECVELRLRFSIHLNGMELTKHRKCLYCKKNTWTVKYALLELQVTKKTYGVITQNLFNSIAFDFIPQKLIWTKRILYYNHPKISVPISGYQN